MSRIAFRRLTPVAMFVLALAIFFPAVVRGQAKAEPKAEPKGEAKADAHAEDRAAIRTVMESFVKAFESGNAAGLAAHWTTEGEYHNDAGKTVRGRENLQKAFAQLFARTPERKAEIRPRAVRFLSASSAVDEGSVTIRKGPAEPAKRAHYTALFIREEAQWRLAMLTETPDNAPAMDDLNWLIGSWKSASQTGADIQTTYAWDANKKFIHVEFKITEKDKATLSGKQVIGVDPATQGIRSWTFESNGGVGEADWHADGDHWELHAEGTLTDGRTLHETNILRRISDDVFTWQSVHRQLGDVEIADLPPVKVSRIKAEIQKAERYKAHRQRCGLRVFTQLIASLAQREELPFTESLPCVAQLPCWWCCLWSWRTRGSWPAVPAAEVEALVVVLAVGALGAARAVELAADLAVEPVAALAAAPGAASAAAQGAASAAAERLAAQAAVSAEVTPGADPAADLAASAAAAVSVEAMKGEAETRAETQAIVTRAMPEWVPMDAAERVVPTAALEFVRAQGQVVLESERAVPTAASEFVRAQGPVVLESERAVLTAASEFVRAQGRAVPESESAVPTAASGFARGRAPVVLESESAVPTAASDSVPGAGAGAAGAGLRPGTHYASTAALADQRSDLLANAHYPAYRPGAYAQYPAAWRMPNAAAATSLYAATTYAVLAQSLGMAAQPAPYDYGGNVVAQPQVVYVNGEPSGTPAQYSEQATQLAGAGTAAVPPDQDGKWMTLGVFALVVGQETTSDDVFQLAVNPQGVLRGNYHNVKTNDMEPLTGSVDKKTQKVAWTIGKDKTPVYEAGLVNLTKDATPLLVHTADGVSQVSLIRLEQPPQ